MVTSPRDVHTLATVSALEALGDMRDRKLWALVMSLLVFAACKSETKIAFERVAKQINPILATLKSKVGPILKTRGGDQAESATTIEACKFAEPELERLRLIDLTDQRLDRERLDDGPAP